MRIHSESIFYKIAGIFNSNRTLSLQSNNRVTGITTQSYNTGGTTTHQTGGFTQAGFLIDFARWNFDLLTNGQQIEKLWKTSFSVSLAEQPLINQEQKLHILQKQKLLVLQPLIVKYLIELIKFEVHLKVLEIKKSEISSVKSLFIEGL